ncbi:MAG: hypothetical protein C3F02_00310 [Parcubacteria group bacterium]|nr:MAG: hypothetical protein C3F02_00310 [Parcubacteria group bacterium]
MKNILFLGTKPIGYKCLEILIKNKERLGINIRSVLTVEDKNFDSSLNIETLSKNNNLPVISNLDDIIGLKDVDILISVQYHLILKQEHIDVAKQIAINLHMAPLPEYRGCNQFSFAIINDDKVFGTTLHRLEAGIDSGDIIAEKRFAIPENCYVSELYDLTFDNSLELFEAEIGNIVSANYKLTPQKDYYQTRKHSIHYRKEITDIKKIDVSWPAEKIFRYVRATSMPNFEPPYFTVGEERVYLIPNKIYKK